jgi:hypothetical protein
MDADPVGTAFDQASITFFFGQRLTGLPIIHPRKATGLRNKAARDSVSTRLMLTYRIGSTQ